MSDRPKNLAVPWMTCGDINGKRHGYGNKGGTIAISVATAMPWPSFAMSPPLTLLSSLLIYDMVEVMMSLIHSTSPLSSPLPLFIFLDAFSHLYKRVCLSVGWYIGWSVTHDHGKKPFFK